MIKSITYRGKNKAICLQICQIRQKRDTKRILVVDDEPRMIGFIRMNLELEGHQVIEAITDLKHWMPSEPNYRILSSLM